MANNKQKKQESLTLDEIEQEMVELSKCQETSKMYVCSQRFDMLSKLAAFKLKRLEIDKAKEEAQAPVPAVNVEFKNPKDSFDRVEKMKEEIDGSLPKA